MKEIFPSEIIETSVEHHFARFSRKSNLLYLFVLLFFAGAVISLFYIQTEITVQSPDELCNIISVKLISHGLYFLLERGKAHQQEHAPADVPSRPQILPIDPFLSIFSHMPSPHAIPSTRL